MSEQDEKITRSLFTAAKRMKQLFYAHAQEQGLATAQWGGLKVLWNNDGLTISEMSQRLFSKNSTITTLVDRMERDGYVKRKRAKEDRRVVKVYLTDKGLKIKDSVVDFETHFMSLARGFLSDEELSNLISLLNKLSEGLGSHIS
ncbi:MAG: MarR family winged helix-turn-helix transcriptional regulator [Desulfocucumaceae bacterium]